MPKILRKSFFNRPALKVARELLGKFLVRELLSRQGFGEQTRKSASRRRKSARRIAVMITEVEAYIGPHDKASHASRGRTQRTEIMFGEAGRFYVYFTYGMHWMLNVVTDKKDYPSAVLIRGGIPSRGIAGRGLNLNGPARLTKFLKIDKRFNGKMADQKTGLWFEDRGIKINPAQIKRSPRVGVNYAGRWAQKPYNFKLIVR